jgi:hypothetical protein
MRGKRRFSRNPIWIIGGFTFLAILWSCDLEARSVVVSGDVVDLLSGKIDEVLLEASIQFPKPSDDVKLEIVDFLSRHFRKFGNLKQIEKGLSSFVSADVAFPMKRAGSRIDPKTEDLLTLFAAEDGSSLAISLRISEKRYKEISDFVFEKTMQEISLKDLSIVFEFKNDSYVELNFEALHSYVDGEPVMERAEFSLESEGTKEILLGDVFRDQIAAKESAEILRFWW